MTHRLDLATFEAVSHDYDRAVMETQEIDHFCSSSDWILPAFEAFHPASELFAFQLEGGYLPLARSFQPTVGRYLAPLEAMWGLASPVATEDLSRTLPELISQLKDIEDEWDTLWLCGLNRDSHLFLNLAGRLSQHYRLGFGPPTFRHTATLEGGWDGYLGRRSSKFRKNIRRVLRNFEAADFTLEIHDDVDAPDDAEALYERMVEVERRSWKGLAGSGIESGAMKIFYRLMVRRLAPRKALRVMVAQRDGLDVAFVFGGVRGGVFRGLQLSFDESLRSFSLGNVMQALMIQHLCDQGVHTYDLGTDLEYKTRWSETGLRTEVLAVLKP